MIDLLLILTMFVILAGSMVCIAAIAKGHEGGTVHNVKVFKETAVYDAEEDRIFVINLEDMMVRSEYVDIVLHDPSFKILGDV